MKWGLTENIGGLIGVAIYWIVGKLFKNWKVTLGVLFAAFLLNTTYNTFK